jgi:hypothetical protein
MPPSADAHAVVHRPVYVMLHVPLLWYYSPRELGLSLSLWAANWVVGVLKYLLALPQLVLGERQETVISLRLSSLQS